MALALHTFKDHLYLAGPPIWLQKPPDRTKWQTYGKASLLLSLAGFRLLLSDMKELNSSPFAPFAVPPLPIHRGEPEGSSSNEAVRPCTS
jgi:hypothetical protein